MARTYHIIKCELLRLHSSFDGHEQCCLHGAWMNLLLLCSLYPAACLRDHSPPLPLFHPERKNLQRVCRFECWPRTLPQHQNQNAISHDIKPTMSFFTKRRPGKPTISIVGGVNLGEISKQLFFCIYSCVCNNMASKI